MESVVRTKKVETERLVLIGDGADEEIASLSHPEGMILSSAQNVEINIDSNDDHDKGDTVTITHGKDQKKIITVHQDGHITFHKGLETPPAETACVDVVIGPDNRLYRKA